MSQGSPEVKARYREKNREKLRAWNRDYAARKRREAGMPARGTPESTENMRRARKLRGPEHPNWKGDQAGYFAIHAWLARWATKTGSCTSCGAKPSRTEWANLSGEYRRDLGDYIEVCVPCHRRMDRGSGLKHGTSTGYGYYGCRCELCRRANTDRKREYLRRKAEASHR